MVVARRLRRPIRQRNAPTHPRAATINPMTSPVSSDLPAPAITREGETLEDGVKESDGVVDVDNVIVAERL